MCGIIGLFLKDPELEAELGRLGEAMLVSMSDRGPDSAGIAIYGAGGPGRTKITLRAASSTMLTAVPAQLEAATGIAADITIADTHGILSVTDTARPAVLAWIAAGSTGVDLVGYGNRLELYKEVGLPAAVASRFGLAGMRGSHVIGHTRMATESAVTTHGAHPFSTGPDQCLVHNGSLSNHNNIRRALRREGIEFETENDTEVAAGYLTWRMREGASLSEALEATLGDLDGFYTFVVGTETGFGVLRDPVSCKPAVMAETDRYVAFGSEFRALAGLPGIEDAHVFEPEPATVYFWERA